MAIKKERSLQWKSETAFFSIKQPPFPIPADYTTQSQVPWAQWLLEPRLVTSRLHEFHFHNWGWEEWIFLAFAASKRSTYLTWRIFICGQQKVDLSHLKDIHLGSGVTRICCLRLHLRVLDFNGGMYRFHSDQKNVKCV